ncbi:MAG: ABC transporter ATP-binding protein/permease [Actinomycetota bacterium]|nr:ABC transporter ATP-binding protein/permease [Actinomycetota bacterium]
MTASPAPEASRRELQAYLAALLRPQWPVLTAAVASTVLAAAATMATPLLVRYALDAGVTGRDRDALNAAVIGTVVLALVAAVLTAVRARASGAVAESVLERLRSDTTAHLLTLSPGDLARAGRNDLLGRTTADIEVLGEAARLGVPVLARAVTTLAVGVVVLTWISPPLAAVAALGLVAVVLSARRLVRRTRVVYPRYRSQLASSLGHFGESLAGVRLVQSYGREHDRAAAYQQENDRVIARYLDGMRARNGFFPTIAAVQVLVVAATLVAGAALVGAGRATVGTVAAATLAVTTLYQPVAELAETLDLLENARAALGRSVGILGVHTSLAVPQHPHRPPRPIPADSLELRGITFAYHPGQPVLRGVDLTLAPGERVALVGESGAGKSTLARIAARLADPDAGSATYGGVPLRDLAPADLRSVVMMAPQEGAILTGTLADNVRLGRPDARDSEIEAVLADLGLSEWLATFPRRLATPVGVGGRSLSAGERQLVGLARIPIVAPRVVVLDEATSALDLLTARLVEQALSRALEGRSLLLVAHRATSAARADRVVVLADGRVTEQGTPAALLGANGRYARLEREWSRGVRR